MVVADRPSGTVSYPQSIANAHAAWQQQSGLTVGQVQAAYQQASVSLAQRIAKLPATAPSTAWNLQQIQNQIDTYGANLDQRVLDAIYSGVAASYHHAGSPVVSGSGKVLAETFGPEAVDELVRSTNQQAATAFLTRTGADGLVLSDRVWKANTTWRQAVQRLVSDAIVSGQAAPQVAKSLEQYLAPGANVPYKADTAKRLNVPKDTSMPAMRVARTEMQNAFHEGTINANTIMPSYQGSIWRLSGSHPVPDQCNEYAEHNGNGFWPKGEEPHKPHPHCFCTLLPQHTHPDQFASKLEDWLNDPKADPELEQWYQQTMKPVLEVNVASVAGASGGPLLGGYSKGEKVTIQVNGQDYVATILGEHATKGVLRLKIDPGQGIADVIVWRSPTKIKPYSGPPPEPLPAEPPPPPIPVAEPPAAPTHPLPIGTTVIGQAGITLNKVGTVTQHFPTGVVKVEWTDGTSLNVPPSILKIAPPPVEVKVGDTVKVTKPALPLVDGQLGEVTAVGTGGVAVKVKLADGTTQLIFIKHAETHQLEVVPGVQTLPGVQAWVGANVLIDSPGSMYHGKVGKVTGKSALLGDNWVVDLPDAPGVGFHPDEVKVVAGSAPPPPEPPKPIGYVDIPGHSKHGQAVYEIKPDTLEPGAIAIKLGDGSYAYGIYEDEIKPHPPEPPEPKPTPPPPTAVSPYKVGDKLEITQPQSPYHGQVGTITQVSTSQTFAGVSQVKMPDGFMLYLSPAEIATGAKLHTEPTSTVPAPPVPTSAGPVDVTVKGTKITTDYKGQQVTGTVVFYNQGKNVVKIKPDPGQGDLPKDFTKSPKLVTPLQVGTPPIPEPPPPPPEPAKPKTVNDAKVGDTLIVDLPGSPLHGEEVTLMTDLPASMAGLGIVSVETSHGTIKSFMKSELKLPGEPITPAPAPEPVLAQDAAKGDTVQVAYGLYEGQVGKVKFVATSTGNAVVEFPDGTVMGFPQDKITVTAKSTGEPAPEPPKSTAKVTDKGVIVTTDYQGQLVTAKVQAHNVGKNVVVLKPINPPPGVPAKFTKSPGKVKLVESIDPAIQTPTTTASQTPEPPPGSTVPVQPKPAPVAAPAHPTEPPDISTWTKTNQAVGGGHAKTIYKTPTGETWMFKPDPTPAFAEKAGYNVMDLLGLETPEMHVTTIGGQVGSLQKFHAITDTVRLNALGSLTGEQRAQIQQHQIVDWLISQHDSNDGAMLIGQRGQVLAIDKGQAFKFLGRDTLHWTYKPNPNMLVYQPLFEGYIKGKYVLDRAAVEPIVQKIEQMDEAAFIDAIKPYATHAVQQGFWANEQQIYDVLIKRKRTIRADVGRMYDEADKLAGRAVAKAPVEAPTDAITPVTSVLLNTIKRTGWAGHAVLVAGADIEDGKMLAYTPRKRGDGYSLVVEGKIRPSAEKKLLEKLDGISHAAAVTGAPVDPFWSNLLPAIKHIGAHLKPGGNYYDGVITESKVMPLINAAKEVQGGKMPAGKAAHYADVIQTTTGWSADVVATQPVSAVMDQIKHYWQTSTAVHSAVFDQYVPPDPAEKEAPPTPAKFKAKTEQPYGLPVLPDGGELAYTPGQRYTGAQYGYEGSSVHTIDLAPGIRGVYHPHSNGGNRYSKQGRLQIIVDDLTDESTLQTAMGFLDKLGVDDGIAKHDDMELLYLIHQAHAMKLEADPSYKSAVVNKYTADMTAREKVQLHLDFFSQKMGVPDVRKLPTYNPRPQFDNVYRPDGPTYATEPGGWGFFTRFDMTKEDIDKKMPGWGLSHRTKMGAEGLLQVMLDSNGHMLNTEERVRNGVYRAKDGDSSSTDMGTGGASYLFTRIQNPDHFFRADYAGKPHFIFSPELLLRTDNISYSHDSFGNADPASKTARGVTIEQWKQFERNNTNETIIKNGFPVFDYLIQINAQSSAEKTRIINMLKSRGISEIRGKPVESIVKVMQ